MEELKYVIFEIGNNKYAMNLKHIKGIEQDYQIIPVPNAPMEIIGIINLRGAVVPVCSLRRCFNLEDNVSGAKGNLLVTRGANGDAIAYEVDNVVTIEQMIPEDINGMPKVATNAENDYMESVLHVGSDIVITVNANQVLPEEVRQALTKLTEEQEA